MNDQVVSKENSPFFMGRFPFLLLLFPALLGTFATGFLTYRHVVLAGHGGVAAQSFLCRSDGVIDCDSILLTDYAVLFGFVSSATLGLMGCVFVLWCTINALINERVRLISWALLVLYFFAAIGFSWYYVYIMLFEVDFICTWCLVTHAVNLFCLVTVLVFSIKKRNAFLTPELSTRAERAYFVAGGVLVSLIVFLAAGLWEKTLGFDDTKGKLEELANDPAVMMALIRSSRTYEVPVTAEDPVFGSPEAECSIIFFSDFQCPVCARTESFLRDLVKANPSVLRLVFKNYPLSKECNPVVRDQQGGHHMSCPAAKAAYASFLLGGSNTFWGYGQLLFDNQKQLKSEPWIEFAQRLGLDLTKFKDLMGSDSPVARKLAEDVDLGIKLRLTATPAIFFEGKIIPETFRGEYLISAVEQLITDKHPEKKEIRLNRPWGSGAQR
jgi:protein-disulfide isomerase/uncharacterized membrane protein